VLKMEDGRKPASEDDSYKVPILKFVIGGPAEDNSQIPQSLRPLPVMQPPVRTRRFELERGGVSGPIRDQLGPELGELSREFEWLVNGKPFIPDQPLALLTKGQPEIWTITSGGGWGHPMHFHQEEHQMLSRNGVKIPRTGPVTDEQLADDIGKEDTVALNGSETVVLYRNFRTFPAPGIHEARYVAHCHNLAHEDHSMMFGWSILDV
jgi:FtsP/CotA-like multicopper oxidase with cupredoxin domain